MKNLFNEKIVSSKSSGEDAKIKREKLLKKQLEIAMVNQGGIDNRMIIGAVNNTNKRKAKLEARKALVVPSKRSKLKDDSTKNNDNITKGDDDIDEEVVENIFDQIMGDEESSTSSIDEMKSEVTKEPSTKVSQN